MVGIFLFQAELLTLCASGLDRSGSHQEIIEALRNAKAGGFQDYHMLLRHPAHMLNLPNLKTPPCFVEVLSFFDPLHFESA